MVFLVFLGAFLIFAASILYWLLGTNRYGGDRPAATLQLTAREAAMADAAREARALPHDSRLFHQALALR